jgi:hypothetical protein
VCHRTVAGLADEQTLEEGTVFVADLDAAGATVVLEVSLDLAK